MGYGNGKYTGTGKKRGVVMPSKKLVGKMVPGKPLGNTSKQINKNKRN